MANGGLPVDRLRDFLRELKPEARALLMNELERAAAKGNNLPGGELVLRELRALITPVSNPPPRVQRPSRLFFQFFEPFLTSAAEGARPRGLISRDSLEPIWEWLCRDLVPVESKAFSDEAARLLTLGDIANSERITRAFQDRVAHRIEEELDHAQADEKVRRRLSVQVGTPHALDDVREVLGILRARDALGVIGSRLPGQIRNLADEQLDNVKAVLESPVARNPHVLPYAVLLVLSRLGARWHLIRLAVRAAESDIAARVAETPLGIAVSFVLADVEQMVTGLRQALKTRRIGEAVNYLKDIHDFSRGLRTELDLSVESPWARQLSAIRADVSDLLKFEIDSIPGRVRRLLRPRPGKEIAAGSVVDQGDVVEMEQSLELLGGCRIYASELAMNEVALRVNSELQNYFDTGTPTLLEALRGAGPGDRAFRKSQLDAAVLFSAKLYGANYAGLLAKAAEVAGQATVSERKAAKA